MGGLRDTLPGGSSDPFFGGAQAAASVEAAGLQSQLSGEAIDLQRESLANIRRDLSPFTNLGNQAAPLLSGAADDPTSRILNSPFFQAQARDQEQRTLAQQAARGKLGSGETGDLLTQGILNLGSQFQQQEIGNLSNLTRLGQSSAAQVGAQTGDVAAAGADILTRQGNAVASGIIGAGNAKAQGTENTVGLGATIAVGRKG